MSEGAVSSSTPHSASGLITDFYQLTMAAGYHQLGRSERQAVFHLFFRRAPFGGAYAVACGLEQVVDFLRNWHFTEADLAYLAEQRGNDEKPLFQPRFLDFLHDIRFTGDLDAMPEGTVVFPHQPILRVRAPLAQAQLLETVLLTMINFQTLIATKAARVCTAAAGDPVLDFGLRRAQGLDGGLSASRAAYVGGCVGTSNVQAGQRFGIPVKGTHAHSWILSFDDEAEAFQAYADVMPNNCTFLVDTYDTARGIDRAIDAAHALRKRGHRLVGVRLDSGDLASLSRMARTKLDDAGFPDAKVVASNNLDEHRIAKLKAQGAAIDLWGVGTQLITGGGEGALGGVYKLAAIEDAQGEMQDRIKLSEDAIKSSVPGAQQVRRWTREGTMCGDVLFRAGSEKVDPRGAVQRDGRTLDLDSQAVERAQWEDLLCPVLRAGQPVAEMPTLDGVRSHAQQQLASLPASVRRLRDPEPYAAGMDSGLFERWQALSKRSL